MSETCPGQPSPINPRRSIPLCLDCPLRIAGQFDDAHDISPPAARVDGEWTCERKPKPPPCYVPRPELFSDPPPSQEKTTMPAHNAPNLFGDPPPTVGVFHERTVRLLDEDDGEIEQPPISAAAPLPPALAEWSGLRDWPETPPEGPTKPTEQAPAVDDSTGDLLGPAPVEAPKADRAITKQLTFLDAAEGEPKRYTGVLGSGIYEPKDRRPHILELANNAPALALIREVEASDLPDAEKRFLISAAHRHTVFNYELCADYYAHASPAMQRLMEASALVIVDFDSAIERGYVKLCKAVRAQYLEERSVDDEN